MLQGLEAVTAEVSHWVADNNLPIDPVFFGQAVYERWSDRWNAPLDLSESDRLGPPAMGGLIQYTPEFNAYYATFLGAPHEELIPIQPAESPFSSLGLQSRENMVSEPRDPAPSTLDVFDFSGIQDLPLDINRAAETATLPNIVEGWIYGGSFIEGLYDAGGGGPWGPGPTPPNPSSSSSDDVNRSQVNEMYDNSNMPPDDRDDEGFSSTIFFPGPFLPSPASWLMQRVSLGPRPSPAQSWVVSARLGRWRQIR